ncbi:hypothetical protein PR048_018634 [Dryococelus australis]|uniref:Uncharacterized protein n=1 Tax=Dryococelus australis TaxID=614101 RepID=A0ABQ9HCY3_9NEOP|nr:hypothetical protein PR048_018634 [Dryococelus australis]
MPNLYNGPQFAITIPVSSAGAERRQERSSSLSLIHIKAALLKEIGVEPVVQEFALKARKLNFQMPEDYK